MIEKLLQQMKPFRLHLLLCICLCFSHLHTKGQLIADFEMFYLSRPTVRADSGCIPNMIIQFIDRSTFNGSPLPLVTAPFNSHHWDFDYNGNISNNKSPVYGFFTPGTYNITLTVTQDGVTYDSITKTLLVFQPPSPRIIATPNSGCDPLTVTFTNNSFSMGSAICTTLIDFGDGRVRRKTGAAALDTFMHTYNLIPQQSCWTVTITVTDCRGCDSTKTFPNMVCIDRPPVACFTASDSLICGRPFNVNFPTNCSQSVNTLTYSWDFGDGNSSTLRTPTHLYDSAGCFTVTLIATDTECGDTDSYSKVICTSEIDAGFVASQVVVCQSGTVQFTDTSLNATGWDWDFGDGTPHSTARNPTHVYQTPGTFTVTLTVRDNTGCTSTETKTNYINVVPAPTVDFTATPTTNCAAPLDVAFTSFTNTPNASFTWNFGMPPPGATSTIANPQFTYPIPGNFNVTLEVTDTVTGCTKSRVKNNFITIQPKTVCFQMVPKLGCAPLEVEFINCSDPAFTIFSWNFGDSTAHSALKSPTHTFVNPGTYIITYSAATPGFVCTETIVDSIKVGSPLQPVFAIDSNPACVNEEIIFRNLTDTTGFNNVFFTWEVPGTYYSFDPPPQFYDEPTPPNDSLEVRLITYVNGCRDTATLKLVILDPKAEFTVEYSCDVPGKVIVTDSSKGADIWKWNFGDSPDTIRMPSQRPHQDTLHHTYNLSGNYIITLVVESSITGCTTEKIIPVEVSVLKADFIADKQNACVGEDVCFTNRSTGLLNGNEWDFGDSSPINGLLSPCHSYSQPGTYIVKLKETDQYGCTDIFTLPTSINVSGVTADFTSPDRSGCIPPTGNDNTFTFNDLSTSAPNSTITESHWNFGGVQPPPQNYPPGAVPSSVTATYTNAGLYTITLTVKNSRGCEDTETKTNYIDVRRPRANFNMPFQNYCLDQPVNFTHSSQGTGLQFAWDFGDGTLPLDTRANPSHTYSVQGCYDVSLTVTDGIGCTDSWSVDSAVCVSEIESCIFADDTSSVCPPHLACFDTCFNFFNVPIKNILWDFGDGSFSTILNPCHIYVRAGRFAVTAYIELANFCTDTLVEVGYIFVGGATGNITAQPDTGCVPMDVLLDAHSQGAVSHFWITPWDTYSTGTIGGSTLNTTIYKPGSWLPAVVLTDAQVPEPCSYILYADFDLWADTVYADFWTPADTVCRADLVEFRDTSTALLDSNISRWEWDFGDGTTDTVQHPFHVFTSVGPDTVCLTAYSSFDCFATVCKYLFVRDKPTAAFTVSDTTGCDTLVVNFTDMSTPGISAPIDKWYWNFDNDTVNQDTAIVQSPSYTYRDTGQYLPYLVVTDVDGCDDTATVAIGVYKTPDGIYNNDSLDLCWGDTVQLLADSAYSSYQWTPNIGLSNDTIFNPLAFPTVTTDYEVLISEPHGCNKTDTVNINVIPLPPLTITPYPDTTICHGSSVQLNAIGGSNHVWVPDFYLNDDSIANPISQIPDTTIRYTVTNEGVGGCTNSDTVRIIVSRLRAKFIGERSCFGDSTNFVDFSTRTALPIISWQWNFGDLNNGTSSLRNPAYTYNTADSFLVQLVITDALGCTDDTSQIVIIDTPATALAGFDTTICVGASVLLFSSGGAIVYWTPNNQSIDSVNIFNPLVTPTVTTTYTANITNGVCPYDQAAVTITVMQPPGVQTIDNTTILRGERIQLVTSIERYDSIWWMPGDSLSCINCPSPFASPDETITYRIDVRDEFGCTNYDEVTIDVTVECKEDQIWIANAFMPNSAEFPENRIVKAHLIGLEKMNYFRIYDRWGKLMFETTDENEGWNGTNMDGVKVSGGVYVFLCEAVCWYKKTIIKTGNVTLIR